MGNGQPYLYDAPAARYSQVFPEKPFDPKVVTRGSYTSLPPVPKREGPLINACDSRVSLQNFNRHPDSYLVVPYGNLDAKPMNAKHKQWIKWSRWVQLGLRIAQLIGCLGLLICAICLKGMQDAEGWIIRLPVRRPIRLNKQRG